MSESHEGNLYSAPEERADKLERRIERTDAFIDALEAALERQRQALADLHTAEDISDDEKATRLEGIQQSIEEVIARITEEEERNAERSERHTKLRHIHEQGKILLDSIEDDASSH